MPTRHSTPTHCVGTLSADAPFPTALDAPFPTALKDGAPWRFSMWLVGLLYHEG